MALTPQDVIDVLKKCVGYAPDQTPTPNELTIQAWCEHFGSVRVDRDEAMEAVRRYFLKPHDRMVQPADISAIARDMRKDFLDRFPPLRNPSFAEIEDRREAVDSYKDSLRRTAVTNALPRA